MTKVQIKPEKFTPVGGLFYVANQFMHHIMPHVDNYLGRRSQLVGYQYVRYFSQWLAISSVGATYNYSKTKMLQK